MGISRLHAVLLKAHTHGNERTRRTCKVIGKTCPRLEKAESIHMNNLKTVGRTQRNNSIDREQFSIRRKLLHVYGTILPYPILEMLWPSMKMRPQYTSRHYPPLVVQYYVCAGRIVRSLVASRPGVGVARVVLPLIGCNLILLIPRLSRSNPLTSRLSGIRTLHHGRLHRVDTVKDDSTCVSTVRYRV